MAAKKRKPTPGSEPPAVEAPQQGVRQYGHRGRPFRTGSNSHTGEVFRRGKDQIPRGSTKLMLSIVQLDQRQAIYDGLSLIARSARTKPLAFLKLIEMIGDRTEGKPTQRVEAAHRSVTVFMREGSASKATQVPTAVENKTGTTELESETSLGDLPFLPAMPADPG